MSPLSIKRMTTNLRARGAIGEGIAVEYLEKKGYRVVDRNYRYERGEIDIVAEDGDTLVFVEVKSRRSLSYGEPHESVTEKKRAQIRKVAEGYLFAKSIIDRACRFDIISIVQRGPNKEIQHFEDAF